MSALYNPIFNVFLKLGKWRYKIFHGGRGSGKTRHAVLAILKLGDECKVNVLCAREIQNSIADSVHKEFTSAIDEIGLGQWRALKDKIINTYTGTSIIFKGLKSETMSSIKSIGRIDICWIEEAHSVSHKSWSILDPSIRNAYSELWMTFNRELPNDPVYDRYCLRPNKDTYVRQINWDENPYFPDVLRRIKDADYERDPLEARHIWEGQPLIRSEALVFSGRWRVDDFETPKNAIFYHGNDWGFSKDPTTLIRCYEGLNEDGRQCLYIDKAVGGVGIDVGRETASLFNNIETSENWGIISDSARPESISAMKKLGYKIKGAKKGKGSVEDGISHIKSYYEVIIHPDCQNVIDEFSKYSYKVDKKTDEILPVLVDDNNHYIDALRYALEDVMRSKTSGKRINFLVG